ncbi:MAG: hypothetical protein KDD45_00590 [Bdellovibrionales bacterium]|nr:hypothetical protein [Bdellovibrionales bacterium]
MKTKNWMQYILDSQVCEDCGKADLAIKKQTVLLSTNSLYQGDDFTVYFTPLLVCKSCHHTHISNAVLGALREQFLIDERITQFDFNNYQQRLVQMTTEEQWVEENYYFSTTAVDCGFEIKTFQDEENEHFNQTMKEVTHG